MRLCFVGLLKLDGQKTIWLEQLRRLPRDRYYHHYVPPSKGMRRPGFEAEKPYRMPSQPSFLTKENLRLRQ